MFHFCVISILRLHVMLFFYFCKRGFGIRFRLLMDYSLQHVYYKNTASPLRVLSVGLDT